MPLNTIMTPCRRSDGTEECVGEVDLGVGGIEADRLLRAGQDNGLFRALDQIGEGGGGIGHGVRAVADNEAVVAIVVLLNGLCKRDPVLRPDVGGVQTEQLDAVHAAEFRYLRHKAEQLLGCERGPEAVLPDLGGDGAAGADH